MVDNIKKSKPIFMDFETHDLYGEICMVQLYQSHWKEAIVIEYPDTQELIKFIKNHHTVWYGASYDLGTVTYQAQKNLGLNV